MLIDILLAVLLVSSQASAASQDSTPSSQCGFNRPMQSVNITG
jgi:hypothetical protein